MFLYITFFFLPQLFLTAADPCIVNYSVDITDGLKFDNGSISHNNITYPQEFVFNKTVSNETRTHGCLCDFRICIRKCCPLGSVFYNGTGRNLCTHMPEYDNTTRGVDLYEFGIFVRNIDVQTSDEYAIIFGRPGPVYKETMKTYLQIDGTLFISTINKLHTKSVDKYCVDTFVTEAEGVRTVRQDALVCFATSKEDHDYLKSSSCMLVSCFFILLTVVVYSWLPELRNLHGRVLMAYLACLFVGFILLASMQLALYLETMPKNICVPMTLVIYYFLIASFFWLNVMCFDIWWTFSGKGGVAMEMPARARFRLYAMYAFGCATGLTVLVMALDFSDLPYHHLLPLLKWQGCFISDDSKLLYLYGPIVILCVANMCFFMLTALKIAKIKRQTSVLKSKESATHDQHRKNTDRFLLYLKLFVVMGVNWILEVVSAVAPQAKILWEVTDAYNVLIGLIIFIIFVCKRKIFKLMKKRIKDCLSRPDGAIGLRTFSQKSRNGSSPSTSIDIVRTDNESVKQKK